MNVEVYHTHQFLRYPVSLAKRLVRLIARQERLSIELVTVILTGSAIVRRLHSKYMGNNKVTDIITLHYKGQDAGNEAELYINLDQARANAIIYKVPFREEVTRLIFHGMLHVKGYRDKTSKERTKMRELEEKYLRLYKREKS